MFLPSLLGVPLLLGIALLSSLVCFLWLFPVFIVQICIDKIIVQQDSSALITIGILAIVTFLLASGLDLVLGSLTVQLAPDTIPQIFMQLAIEFPRVLLSSAIIFFYNRTFAILAYMIVILGSGIFCFFEFMKRRQRTSLEKQVQSSRQGIIPISSRILVSFTALTVFLYGTVLIVRSEITFGQLPVFICISVQLTISVSNIINSLIQPRPI